VFAPVAAHLANGVPIALLGKTLPSVRALPWPRPARTDVGWIGQVAYVDQYGNLITNLGPAELGDEAWDVDVAGGHVADLSASYAEIDELGAILDSSGHLEIACRNESAARRLDVGVGAKVRCRRQTRI
jgi:S-adenosylmethionine hydrolase